VVVCLCSSFSLDLSLELFGWCGGFFFFFCFFVFCFCFCCCSVFLFFLWSFFFFFCFFFFVFSGINFSIRTVEGAPLPSFGPAKYHCCLREFPIPFSFSLSWPHPSFLQRRRTMFPLLAKGRGDIPFLPFRPSQVSR